jgi:hypothetical protein
MVCKLWLRLARKVNALRRRTRSIPRLYCDDELTAARLRRCGGDEASLVDEHLPKSAEPADAGHCVNARPMIHLMKRNVAKIRVERGEAAPSLILRSSRLPGTKRRGPALVLSCGICHVLHRTALLSQLATHKARSEDPTRRGVGCRWRGRVGRRHGQKAASGRKAARGLPPRRVARPWAQPLSSLPAGGDGGKGAQTWIASGPRGRSFRGAFRGLGGEREYGDECVRFRPV